MDNDRLETFGSPVTIEISEIKNCKHFKSLLICDGHWRFCNKPGSGSYMGTNHSVAEHSRKSLYYILIGILSIEYHNRFEICTLQKGITSKKDCCLCYLIKIFFQKY